MTKQDDRKGAAKASSVKASPSVVVGITVSHNPGQGREDASNNETERSASAGTTVKLRELVNARDGFSSLLLLLRSD